jgi:conjugal transfer pilus assembly protein TraL
VDDLLGFLFGAFFVFAIAIFVVILLLSIVLVRLYGRFRDSRPDGFALHWAYWAGLLSLRGRTTPNPFIRRWLP